MIDVITYCPDITLLLPEVAEKFPEKVDLDSHQFLIAKTPTVRNGLKTMSLVRCVDQAELDDLQSLDNLEILGSFDDVFADPDKLTKYESVYDRTPQTHIDDEGNEYTHAPPERFGGFA